MQLIKLLIVSINLNKILHNSKLFCVVIQVEATWSLRRQFISNSYLDKLDDSITIFSRIYNSIKQIYLKMTLTNTKGHKYYHIIIENPCEITIQHCNYWKMKKSINNWLSMLIRINGKYLKTILIKTAV